MQICAMKCAGFLFAILFLCTTRKIAIIISHIFLLLTPFYSIFCVSFWHSLWFFFLLNLWFPFDSRSISILDLCACTVYVLCVYMLCVLVYSVYEDTILLHCIIFTWQAIPWSCWWKRVKIPLKNALRKERKRIR